MQLDSNQLINNIFYSSEKGDGNGRNCFNVHMFYKIKILLSVCVKINDIVERNISEPDETKVEIQLELTACGFSDIR
jgi:hypothetical protein